MDWKRPLRPALGLVDKIAISATEEDQRRRSRRMGRVASDADYGDDAVATIIVRERLTREMGESTGYQRRVGVTGGRFDLISLVRKCARKLI